MTTTEWIKKISEAKTDQKVLKLWAAMLMSQNTREATQMTLDVHKACGHKVVIAARNVECE
jgi:hypothetical protein